MPGDNRSPIEHEAQRLTAATAAALVARVRASIERASSAALDELIDTGARPVSCGEITTRRPASVARLHPVAARPERRPSRALVSMA
jgi:hypothetical protein